MLSLGKDFWKIAQLIIIILRAIMEWGKEENGDEPKPEAKP